MTSSPITSLQTEEEKVEAVIDFIFLGSKTIADIDLSQKIRRCLVLGRQAMTNIEIKKQRPHIAKKVQIVKALVFPVVIYGCELDHKEG